MKPLTYQVMKRMMMWLWKTNPNMVVLDKVLVAKESKKLLKDQIKTLKRERWLR